MPNTPDTLPPNASQGQENRPADAIPPDHSQGLPFNSPPIIDPTDNN